MFTLCLVSLKIQRFMMLSFLFPKLIQQRAKCATLKQVKEILEMTLMMTTVVKSQLYHKQKEKKKKRKKQRQ